MALNVYLKRIVEQRETLSRNDACGSPRRDPRGPYLHQFPVAPTLTNRGAAGERSALAGGTSNELAGFVDAMRAAATPVPLDEAERSLLIDTCGTGGDLSGTFNISTAAALVAAAASATTGSMVAKHGNRAVTSECGSADVLEALGIPVALSPAAAADALRTHRFAFLHAPSLHPAMKAVMPVRRALGVREFVFNVLGSNT